MEVRVPMKRVHSVNEDLPCARLLESRAAEAVLVIRKKIDGLANAVTCLPKTQEIKITHPVLC